MKTRLYLFALPALMLSLFALPAVTCGTMVIDNFVAGNTLSQFGAGTTSQVTVLSGSTRTDSLTVRDQGGAEFFGALGFGGDFSIGQGSDDRIHGSLRYSNFNQSDFTDGGDNDHFVFTFVSNDLDAPLPDVLTLMVVSDGISEAVSITIPEGSSLPQAVDLGFDEFSSINFSKITSVELFFDFGKQPGRDFVLSSFATAGGPGSDSSVPEPTSAIAIMALGGLIAIRRRRS